MPDLSSWLVLVLVAWCCVCCLVVGSLVFPGCVVCGFGVFWVFGCWWFGWGWRFCGGFGFVVFWIMLLEVGVA